MTLDDRAREIADFLGLDYGDVRVELQKGFHYFHAKVAEDFKCANPQTDAELLAWYQRTLAYVYELSAYHLDEGFNYTGMCKGIADHLLTNGHCCVLCLGDGIGDVTLALNERGLRPIYHDLEGSQTAAFAAFRFQRHGAEALRILTTDFTPPDVRDLDAVVALDVLEHFPNADKWGRAIATWLRVGGIVLFQNAFGIGSPDREGSIPMHLASGTHWEHDWDPFMESLGLRREASGWWRKQL